jgi:aldose sugar dehydrogenase
MSQFVRAVRDALVAGLLALAWAPARAAGPADVDVALERAVLARAEAALDVAARDTVPALARLAGAQGEVEAAFALARAPDGVTGLGTRRARRLPGAVARTSRRVQRARTAVDAGTETAPRLVRRLRRAAAAAGQARALLRAVPPHGFALEEAGRRHGYHRPGGAVTLRVRPGVREDGTPCTGEPDVELTLASPPAQAVVAGIDDLGDGRLALRLGPELGGARVTVTLCGVTRTWLLVNLGPRGALARDGLQRSLPPADLSYAEPAPSYRVGVDAAPNVPSRTGGAVEHWSVTPDLPDGLALDPATGVLAGTPQHPAPRAAYTVTATNAAGSAVAVVEVEVTPPLPPGVEWLADGFVAEPWLAGLAFPVKAVFAPDGRLFFNELLTGRVRVVEADGRLVPEPFAELTVLTGGERGLLGLALAPDFTQSGHLLVYASVPVGGGRPARNQVVRFTAVDGGNVGTTPTVVVDDLPVGTVHNAGDLQFGPDGRLYVSVGDTGTADLAQADGSLAGRVLRYEPDGGVPDDNPVPGSPEWCRGLRNSFDMAFHPVTGGLFASENGPTFGDELNLLLPGRNYEWGGLPPDFPAALVGPRVTQWTPVIAPTGVAFHSGRGFGPEYAGNLFLLGYDEADLRRLLLSGAAFTDLDEELPFARWADGQGVHKPLDLLEGPDGALYVTTFSGIWRIRRY